MTAIQDGARQPARREIAASFSRAVRRDIPFLAVATAYFLSALLILDVQPIQWAASILHALVGSVLLAGLCAALLRFGCYVFVTRPHHPIGQLALDLWSVARRPALVAGGIPVALTMAVFVATFVEYKTHLATFGGFQWDQPLTEIDRIVHFGKLPWEWLQPAIGYWPITFIINVNYQCWLLVVWSVWLAFAFSERQQRTRFLLSFALIWTIGGSFLAILFASAGPCYYDALGISPNPYAQLMTYLHAANEHAPILALNTQDFLWRGHIGEEMPLGISAMPSLHSAIALLMVLASRGFDKRIRVALIAHAVLIFIGSIHLAWHYAVDAYVGWAITLLIWQFIAPVARWWDAREALERHGRNSR